MVLCGGSVKCAEAVLIIGGLGDWSTKLKTKKSGACTLEVLGHNKGSSQ
jgi:hypothetical protein